MFFMLIATVLASDSSTQLFTSRMEFGDFILLSIALIVLFSGIFSIMYILWWGVLLILSWWKDDKIKPAVNSIRYALVWLWVIVLSIFVFPKIAALLGLDVTKYSSPEKIFDEIKVLGDKIFGTSSSSSLEGTDIQKVNELPADFSDL